MHEGAAHVRQHVLLSKQTHGPRVSPRGADIKATGEELRPWAMVVDFGARHVEVRLQPLV